MGHEVKPLCHTPAAHGPGRFSLSRDDGSGAEYSVLLFFGVILPHRLTQMAGANPI